MSTKAVFTMKLEPELRDAFMAAVEADDRPASQVVREFMRTYLAERYVSPEYGAFLQAKIDRARSEIQQGLGRPNSEVDTEFAKLRDSWA